MDGWGAESMARLRKYALLAWFGGATYVTIEVFWRGYSHWTMFVLAALLFILIGMLNNTFSWSLGLVWQTFFGTAGATLLELGFGIVVNLWLGWDIWDYSDMPGNILGQICPQYAFLWIPLVLLAILLDDYLRWLHGEEKPRYTLF